MNLQKALQHVDESLHCVVDKGDHIVITYHHMQPETFRDLEGNICPVRTQFRGICFDKETGNCIRLPYHKFFNLGELQENPINFDEPYFIMNKLDGSLVAPYMVGDRLIWGTKSGETDMSDEVKDALTKMPYWAELYDMVVSLLFDGFTPMFEYISPENRIVIQYDKPDLVLIGIRNIETGDYLPPHSLARVAETFGSLPVVSVDYVEGSSEQLVEMVQKFEDSEGVVIQQGNEFLKIKSLWYVQLHKNKELIESERNVVELILDDNIDDVIPLLQEDQKENLLNFVSEFWNDIARYSSVLTTIISLIHHQFPTRKDYGLSLKEYKRFNPIIPQIAFKYYDQQDEVNDENMYGELINALKKSLTSNTKYETFKSLNDLTYPEWRM